VEEDLPLDRGVKAVERSIATPYRGGSVVVFESDRIQGVAGSVTIATGGRTVVPEFGDLAVVTSGRRIESPVGRGGSFYLEGLPAGTYQAVVRYLGSSCTFTLTVPDSIGPVIDVGPQRCAGEVR